MAIKRILVYINKVLTIFTGSLVFLLISIPIFTNRKRKRIRIPLALNVVILAIVLLIIAAYGGAFDKQHDGKSAMTKAVSLPCKV